MKWKSLAADRLEHVFGADVEACTLEHPLDAPVSDKEQRFADALVLFEERDEQLGRGLAVEVQHRNEDKDITATTKDYLAQDIAVAWLSSGDFSDDRCLLSQQEFRERAAEGIWPERAPSTESFAPSNVPEQTLEGLLATPSTHPDEAMVPSKAFFGWLARSLFRQTAWSDLFTSDLDSEQYIVEVRQSAGSRRVPVRLPQPCVQALLDTVIDDPEKPDGPFEDIQCRVCGHYWHVSKGRDVCQNCGSPVDFEWNVRTGRVSSDSLS